MRSSSLLRKITNSVKSLTIKRRSDTPLGKKKFYKYSPLADDQIRLLRAQKKQDGVIDYALIHLPFDKVPPYSALSYCWENQIPDHDLELDDQSTLKITSNIKNFLPYLSSTEGAHYVWIDGVCINQSDISEKNHQVSFMKAIYSKATNVIIWLGECDSHVDEAIRQISRIVTLSEDYHGSKSGFERALESYEIPKGSEFWKGVEFLLSRPWFSRLWTFQEAVLPKNIEIRYGQSVINGD